MGRRIYLAGWLTLALTAAWAPGAHAATDFYSSFESGDPAPTWENTAETDAQGNKKMSGVTGSSTPGSPATSATRSSRSRRARRTRRPRPPSASTTATSTASGSRSSPRAGSATSSPSRSRSSRYALSSANDSRRARPARLGAPGLPRRQRLDHGRHAERPGLRRALPDQGVRRRHPALRVLPAQHHRQPRRRPRAARRAPALRRRHHAPAADGHEGVRDRGPVNGPTMKPNAGWTGVQGAALPGRHTADGRGYAYDKVFDVDIKVTREHRTVVPDLPRAHQRRPRLPEHVRGRRPRLHRRHLPVATCARVDQQEYDARPAGPGRLKSLYANQWNRKVSDIGAVAAGKTIDRILSATTTRRARASSTAGSTTSASTAARRRRRTRGLSDWVLTTRGTNSTGGFSRGNNIPATAVPHGFNFWTPMTDAGSISWLYAYQQDNNDDNLPRLEAFAASHEPSPWMGDRQTFQVMPSPAAGDAERRPRRSRAHVPARERDRQALPLRREVRERHAHRHRADRPRRAVPLRVHRRRRAT